MVSRVCLYDAFLSHSAICAKKYSYAKKYTA